MSEALGDFDVGPVSDTGSPTGTGDERVDAVLDSLQGLDDQGLSQHLTVFEQAHETLRRTLAETGRDSSAAAGRS